jgi:hypothetical protein
MGEQHRRRRQGRPPRNGLLELVEKDDPGPVRDRLDDYAPVDGAELACNDKRRLFIRNHYALSGDLRVPSSPECREGSGDGTAMSRRETIEAVSAGVVAGKLPLPRLLVG